MEDAVVMIDNFGSPTFENQSFFAVFDGHNGHRCSEFLASELPNVLLRQKDFSMNPCIALINAFQETDSIWLESAKQGKEPLEDGSTAICILVRQHELYVAHAGDSRAILCQDARIISLTDDHKPNNVEEKERIEKGGGFVQNGRIQGVLAVSRAFGDLAFKNKNLLTSYPEVKYWPVTEETEFIVAACDGVWDVISNFKVAEFVRSALINGFEPNEIAKQLVNHCLGMGSTDNISLIVISFLTPEKIQKISNSDIKVGEESDYSKTIPKIGDEESKDKFRKIDERNLKILRSSTPNRLSIQVNGGLRKSSNAMQLLQVGEVMSDGTPSPEVSPRKVSPRLAVEGEVGPDGRKISPRSSPLKMGVESPGTEARRMSRTGHDVAHLRVSKNAEDFRRERVKQQSLLHKKVESSGQKNYSTCKF